MKKAQSAPLLALIIFMVFVAGFVLYIMYPFLENFRLEAVADPDNQTQPLLMLILYGLQPIIWGIYIVASLGAIIGVSRAG